MENSNPISRFEGCFSFLSNFHECSIIYDGLLFSSVEAAFQAAKCKTNEERIPFVDMDPRQARAAGRRVALRPDWEERKLKIMHSLVLQKFTSNPELRDKLLATGDTKLLEGNRWHDNFWGNCDCPNCRDKPGLNYLGKILMRVRLELRTGSLDTISIKLPDGKYLTAHSIIRTAHPVINIYLDRPNGTKEILCFAEYNPGRPEGLELCVGAYHHDDDEPSYYMSYHGSSEEECL